MFVSRVCQGWKTALLVHPVLLHTASTKESGGHRSRHLLHLFFLIVSFCCVGDGGDGSDVCFGIGFDVHIGMDVLHLIDPSLCVGIVTFAICLPYFAAHSSSDGARCLGFALLSDIPAGVASDDVPDFVSSINCLVVSSSMVGAVSLSIQ